MYFFSSLYLCVCPGIREEPFHHCLVSCHCKFWWDWGPHVSLNHFATCVKWKYPLVSLSFSRSWKFMGMTVTYNNINKSKKRQEGINSMGHGTRGSHASSLTHPELNSARWEQGSMVPFYRLGYWGSHTGEDTVQVWSSTPCRKCAFAIKSYPAITPPRQRQWLDHIHRLGLQRVADTLASWTAMPLIPSHQTWFCADRTVPTPGFI